MAAYIMTFWVNIDTDENAQNGFGEIRNAVLSDLIGNQTGWNPALADGCIAKLVNGTNLTQEIV